MLSPRQRDGDPVRQRTGSLRHLAIARVLLVLALAGIGAALEVDEASAAGAVRHCPAFTVYRYSGPYGHFSYRASDVVSSAQLSCRMASHLLEAAYGQGPLKITRVVYGRTSGGQPAGRPTYWVRGGWRCTTGAGGAACWNAAHPVYNVLSGAAAVTANVR